MTQPGIRSIAVAQIGARNHYAAARAFSKAGILDRLYTDIYAGNKPALRNLVAATRGWMRPRVMDAWLGRHHPELAASVVQSFDLPSILDTARVRPSARRSGHSAAEHYARCGYRFGARVRRSGSPTAQAIYSVAGSACGIFPWARGEGKLCVLEMTDHTQDSLRELLIEEIERWPSLEPGLGSARDICEANDLDEVEAVELKSSDLIIVASEYTKQSLIKRGTPVEKIRLVPYGLNNGVIKNSSQQTKTADRPLEVIYVGLVNLRKGIPYLLKAMEISKSRCIHLTLVGSVQLDLERLLPQSANVSVVGAVPRSQVSALMRSADLFVFPTLGEGFGLVQIEAMAAGLPVIATDRCGAVVRDGLDGHIIRARDPHAIALLLDRYASDPRLLEPLSASAERRAADFSMATYAKGLCSAIAVQGGD